MNCFTQNVKIGAFGRVLKQDGKGIERNTKAVLQNETFVQAISIGTTV
jgi:hypothetical protein